MVGREFEGAVFNEFGIEPAIGSEVDVFKENAIHGRLDFSPDFLGLYRHGVVLRKGRMGRCHESQTGKQ